MANKYKKFLKITGVLPVLAVASVLVMRFGIHLITADIMSIVLILSAFAVISLAAIYLIVEDDTGYTLVPTADPATTQTNTAMIRPQADVRAIFDALPSTSLTNQTNTAMKNPQADDRGSFDATPSTSSLTPPPIDKSESKARGGREGMNKKQHNGPSKQQGGEAKAEEISQWGSRSPQQSSQRYAVMAPKFLNAELNKSIINSLTTKQSGIQWVIKMPRPCESTERRGGRHSDLIYFLETKVEQSEPVKRYEMLRILASEPFEHLYNANLVRAEPLGASLRRAGVLCFKDVCIPQGLFEHLLKEDDGSIVIDFTEGLVIGREEIALMEAHNRAWFLGYGGGSTESTGHLDRESEDNIVSSIYRCIFRRQVIGRSDMEDIIKKTPRAQLINTKPDGSLGVIGGMLFDLGILCFEKVCTTSSYYYSVSDKKTQAVSDKKTQAGSDKKTQAGSDEKTPDLLQLLTEDEKRWDSGGGGEEKASISDLRDALKNKRVVRVIDDYLSVVEGNLSDPKVQARLSGLVCFTLNTLVKNQSRISHGIDDNEKACWRGILDSLKTLILHLPGDSRVREYQGLFNNIEESLQPYIQELSCSKYSAGP